MELRTEERRVAGFDNRTSKPRDDPSPSDTNDSDGAELTPLKLSEGCQLKSIKSLLNELNTDIYELAPKRLDASVRLGEFDLVKM